MEDYKYLRGVVDLRNSLYVDSGRVAGSRPIENRADLNLTNSRPSSRARARRIFVRECVFVVMGSDPSRR